MNKILTLAVLLFSSGWALSQVEGPVMDDQRKITDSISYQINASSAGILVFDIAVNNNGDVTSCTLNRDSSTQKSMKSAYEAKNKILMTLKFEKGTKFPIHHQGRVIITAQ